MVEGHSVHRVAASHTKRLVGKKFKASSPNGRFTDGATAINNQVFQRIEAVGKNLFAFFGPIKGPLFVVHVHFGMSGQWSVFDSNSEDVPEPTPTTRLRLEHPETGLVSHLSAMTVQLGDEALYTEKRAVLGQDPLRADADADLLFEKVSNSKKTIGQLLMDQSVFAGPGNIYRAEILFKAGVHPNVKGIDLGRARFDRVWLHTVELLRRGFACGSILTVDPDEAKALGNPRLRRYIYNSAHCARCGGRVVSWDVSARTCYACTRCQPLNDADAISQPKASPAKVFVSHCAREPLADRILQGPSKLVVKELRAELERRGLETKGTKAVLVKRLATAMDIDEPEDEQEPTHLPASPPLEMALSAEAAAAEKALAGENRAVEHIAELHPSQAAKAAALARTGKRTRGGGGKKVAGQVEEVEAASEAEEVHTAGRVVKLEAKVEPESDVGLGLGGRQRKVRRTPQTAQLKHTAQTKAGSEQTEAGSEPVADSASAVE
eukprot:CAMPEP_0177730644 /NCGR_PEP_ID=MMETSP0484_2-20121128/22104_1 /TAXON_ID=354590 /ORGANISM="Rhodomonas lens, Strain RHODO" /LENGTH=493 /DNA_ID=CAMNT_0019243657 /DNA_START=443 /DNA_END=1924 /DNA_ORIENTATION=-